MLYYPIALHHSREYLHPRHDFSAGIHKIVEKSQLFCNWSSVCSEFAKDLTL